MSAFTKADCVSDDGGEAEQAGKKKKRWGFFGMRRNVNGEASVKVFAPALQEDDGPPDDVLEVWFSGCHSGASWYTFHLKNK